MLTMQLYNSAVPPGRDVFPCREQNLGLLNPLRVEHECISLALSPMSRRKRLLLFFLLRVIAVIHVVLFVL